MEKNLLEIRDLSVDFKGFKAVKSVDLDIQEGELRVIIGPNGAGKTTLMDMITGKTRPTGGTIKIDGSDITYKAPNIISSKYGISRKFQGPNVFDNLTVYDNILIAVSGYSTVFRTITFRTTRKIKNQVNEILEFINLSAEKEMRAVNLSHGQRQWLEIGMVLAQDARVLILDEPTSGMTASETFKTGELILRLKKTGKYTMLVIEHDMDFVKQIAEKVTVLHLGQVLAEGTYEEIEQNEEVLSVYLKDTDDENESREEGEQ